MPFSHVIFDLDGTLLNTIDDIAAAGNHTCELFGWPTHSVDRYRHMVGDGVAKLVERFMPAEFVGDTATFERALDEQRTYYDAHKNDSTAPYEGVPAMLDALAEAGVTLAVLTNKEHMSAQPIVESYFGTERFALVQGRTPEFPPKPEPPATLHVLSELGVDPANALYVGDSNVDVRCGHNAGLKVCGVAWGFRGRAELEAEGAEYVIDRPGELVSIVLGE